MQLSYINDKCQRHAIHVEVLSDTNIGQNFLIKLRAIAPEFINVVQKRVKFMQIWF